MADEKAVTFSPTRTTVLTGAEAFSTMLFTRGDTSSNNIEIVVERQGGGSSFKDHMFEQLNQMRREERLCDIVIWVGSEETPLKAHANILAGFSEYFRGQVAHGGSAEIRLPSVNLESMQAILDYAYTGRAKLTRKNAHNIVLLAQFFQCKILMDECCAMIEQCLSIENCAKVLQFAYQFSLKPLKRRVKIYGLDHLEEVHRSNLDFVKLPFELLIELAKSPRGVLHDGNPQRNEEDLFMFLWNVVRVEKHNKQKHIVDILKTVHLPLVSLEFLQNVESKVCRIQEARELTKKARQMSEVNLEGLRQKDGHVSWRTWCSSRGKNSTSIKLKTSVNAIEMSKEEKLLSGVGFIKGCCFGMVLKVQEDDLCVELESPCEDFTEPFLVTYTFQSTIDDLKKNTLVLRKMGSIGDSSVSKELSALRKRFGGFDFILEAAVTLNPPESEIPLSDRILTTLSEIIQFIRLEIPFLRD